MVPQIPTFFKRLLFLFISLGGIVLFSSACTIKTALPPSPPFHFERQEFENLFKNLSPEITGIKGYGELLLKGSEEREVKINLILKKPGKLRIEILNFLYQPSMLIVSDGREVSISQDGGQVLRTVPANHFNFRKITGEKLSLDDFISIMLGCPPDWPSLKERPFTMERRDNKVIYRLDSSKKETVQLTVSGKSKLLQGYAVFKTGSKVPGMSISWGDYRTPTSGSELKFPHDIRIDWPSKGVRINLTYEKVELDPQIADQFFSL